jgi:hypothetical protein
MLTRKNERVLRYTYTKMSRLYQIQADVIDQFVATFKKHKSLSHEQQRYLEDFKLLVKSLHTPMYMYTLVINRCQDVIPEKEMQIIRQELREQAGSDHITFDQVIEDATTSILKHGVYNDRVQYEMMTLVNEYDTLFLKLCGSPVAVRSPN